MFRFGLRAQFFVAGALLLGITVALGTAGALAFARLSRNVGETLSDSKETMQATAAIAGRLEREDDALLLLANGDARGPATLAQGRRDVEASVEQLTPLMTTPDEREELQRLVEAILRYHDAGDELARLTDLQERRDVYHRTVNNRLREAVGQVSAIRNRHLAFTEEAAEFARDEARKAAGIAIIASLIALVAGAAVAVYFGRRVLTPLRALSRSVDALRAGDYSVRVETASKDELGQLIGEFNRMTERLGELRRANIDEVLRANKTLEATLAALPDAVLLVDPDGRVTAANAPGRDLGQFHGGEPQALAALALPPAAIDAVRDVLERRRLQAAQLELSGAIDAPANGEKRKLLPRVMPVPYGGDRQGAVAVLYDVTALVRLDEMRRELVAVASHELKTPLTTLRMTLGMLRESESALTPRQQELVATAFGGIDQLGATVDEFLDFTRIEAGQLRLNWEQLDMAAQLGQVVDSFRPHCEDARVQLDVAIAPSLPNVRGERASLALRARTSLRTPSSTRARTEPSVCTRQSAPSRPASTS